MKSSVITVGNEDGILFKGAEQDSIAFVPVGCVVFTREGRVELDELKYALSRWDIKNMRFNTAASHGRRLYPLVAQPIEIGASSAAQSFVRRLQLVHPSGQGEFAAETSA